MIKTIAILTACLFAQAASAAVLVTEFMADPVGTDADREWFEIYNSGDLPFDLSGYAAGDGISPTGASTGEGMGVFPTGTIINAHQVFVIAVNANGFLGLYGFLPNFEFANTTSTLGNNSSVPDLPQKTGWGVSNGGLAIANGGDDVGILTPDSTAAAFTFIDGSNHGNVTTFFPGAATLGSNQSYERIFGNVDTDSANDWVVRLTNTATPGVVAVSVPEPGALGSLVMGLGGLGVLRWRRRS